MINLFKQIPWGEGESKSAGWRRFFRDRTVQVPRLAVSRQTTRASLRADEYDRFRVAPQQHTGTLDSPIMRRKDRRKLARAYAAANWREARRRIRAVEETETA